MPRHSTVVPPIELAAGHLIAFNPVPRLCYLEAGWLLATPTSFWQHHIEPQCAFPQQLLQITKIFSLRPPTFLSIKTNELTLTLTDILNPGSDPTVNVSVDHASGVQTARVRHRCPQRELTTGPCVRQRVNVESKSADFIFVLRVSPVTI